MNPVRAFGCLLLIGMGWAITTGHAQGIRSKESAGYWSQQGGRLMQTGEFARAYSAFQLARSLGASGMVQQMEEARRRNINHILLQSLLAEANGLAETDPVQELRLLEYAHLNFPDSSRIIRQIGSLINRPNLWLYSLNGDAIWPSARMHRLVAAVSPARLYSCSGDSLTIQYTFPEPVQEVFFSPDERFVWVNMTTRSMLLDASRQPVQEIPLPVPDVEKITFSPDSRYVLLQKSGEPVIRVWQIGADTWLPTVIIHQDESDGEPLFSPDGRYLFVNAPDGSRITGELWQLTGNQPQRIRQFSEQEAVARVVFDAHSRWLLGAGPDRNALLLADLRADGAPIVRRFDNCYTDRLSAAFAPAGNRLLVSFIRSSVDSLWVLNNRGLDAAYAFRPPPDSSAFLMRVLSRFSPDGTWLLRSSPSERLQTECWSLHGDVPQVVHRFQQKTNVVNDVFSPDSRYLLSRHWGTIRDSLWRLDPAGLQPIHGFQTLLRTAGRDGEAEPLAYFSAGSNYLVTYQAGAMADSLWLLDESRLQPLYGFRQRLSMNASRFSADGRWFAGGEGEMAGATLYNLPVLRDMLGPRLPNLFTEARFSGGGQYLLGRTTASDSATVLYRMEGGQVRLIQKLIQPFRIDECRFLANDRFLFTYHKVPTAPARQGQFANYIWRLTSEGLQSFVWLPSAPVREAVTLGGQFRLAAPTSGGRNVHISRGLVVAADGQYLLTHTWTGRPDSLWRLTDQLRFMPAFDRQSATLTMPQAVGDRTPTLTLPEAGFVGNHLWSRNATDSTISLHRLQANSQTLVPLPSQVRDLLGYSPITKYGVFRFTDRPDAPELWQYSAGKWRFVQKLPRVASHLNRGWPDSPFANLISPDGKLLLVPTIDNRLYLYRLGGAKPVMLASQRSALRWFSFLQNGSVNGQTNGLAYSDTRQTYILLVNPAGCRQMVVGNGTLRLPAVCQAGQLYLTRQVIDNQTAVDVLEQATGSLLARMVVRQFLDWSVRPNGTVWVMTQAGIRALYTPTERLTWLRRSIVALLSPGLQRKYMFQ